jgi:hypothetical protein
MLSLLNMRDITSFKVGRIHIRLDHVLNAKIETRRESRYIKTLYSGFYTRSGYMKYKDT